MILAKIKTNRKPFIFLELFFWSSKMLRARIRRNYVDTHEPQQELDDIFVSMDSMLELYNNLQEISK